ncbi:MAG: hypothetical protein M1814_006794 [Vezdaea aestivalis]|nr:MAG: hypothetical protein M1814_006794 [Vezdaea aestivalis]
MSGRTQGGQRGGRGGERGGRGGERGGRGGERGGRGRGERQDTFPRGGDRGGRGGDRGGGGGRYPSGGRPTGNYPPPSVRSCPAYKPNYAIGTPSSDVRALEDRKAKLSITSKGPNVGNLSLTDRYPMRPGYGSQGLPGVLLANYYTISVNPAGEAWYYTARFEPDKPGKSAQTGNDVKPRQLRQLFQQLITKLKDEGVRAFSDYGLYLVTDKKIANVTANIRQEDLTLTFPDGVLPTNPPVFKLRLEYVGALDFPGLEKNLKDPNPVVEFPDKAVTIQMANIVMNGFANTSPDIVAIRQKKFFNLVDRLSAYSIGGGLDVSRGFFSSVRSSTGRLLLNLQITTCAFYDTDNVRVVMDRLRESGGARSLNKLQSFFKGVRVSSKYLKDKKGQPIVKFHSIRGLCRQPFAADANRAQFYNDEFSRQQSVAQFFKQKHGINLQYAQLPVMDVGTPNKAVLIPPECLTIVRGQAANQKLTGDQTTYTLAVGQAKAAINANLIDTYGIPLFGLSNTPPPTAPFGLKVLPGMITVQCRILDAPSLIYRAKSTEKTEKLDARFGAWNLSGRRFARAASLTAFKWGFINLRYDNRQKTGEIDLGMTKFAGMVAETGILGFRPAQGQHVAEIPLGGTQGDGQHRRQLDKVFKEASDRNFRLILMVLDKRDTALYAAAKYLADVKHGIHTVFMVHANKKFHGQTGGTPDYCANVAHKINSKFGGTNQKPDPRIHYLSLIKNPQRTMVMGMDVTHPAPGSERSTPSIAAVVASVDPDFTLYPASVMAHQGRVEVIPTAHLTQMVVERLQYYQQMNKQLPTQIIVYRDGVSEGQYPQVLALELPCIRAAVKKLTKENVKISFIIVGKRHHTRFYPINNTNHDDRNSSTKPGTIVDRGVTAERGWDFFLQPHSCGMGTARPAHYVIVHDEIKMGVHDLETFVSGADEL